MIEIINIKSAALDLYASYGDRNRYDTRLLEIRRYVVNSFYEETRPNYVNLSIEINVFKWNVWVCFHFNRFTTNRVGNE